jgi:colanic acid/amylovoran biosynthesis protein
VLLTNSITLNGGDAAIVVATASSLRNAVGADISFTILDRQPEAAARLLPEFEFRPWPWDVFFSADGGSGSSRIRHWATRARAYTAAALIGHRLGLLGRLLLESHERKLLDEYAKADLVISKGGTYLVEIYDLTPHLFDFRLCTLLRRPLVLASQSLGPFTKPRTRRLLRKLLRHALVFVRDEQSRHHLEALGLSGAHVRVSADTAFAFADPTALAAARNGRLGEPMQVAVSVREWRHFRGSDAATGMDRYASSVGALVTHLVRRYDARVTFLSTCQGVADYWTDDSVVASSIAERLPDDVAQSVGIDHDHHSPEELLGTLADFDLVVSTRMHFAILALSAGVPALPIAYEFKTAELFRRLGMSEHILDIESISPDEAVHKLEAFIETLPAKRRELFDRVEAQRRLAEDSVETIAALLRERAR